MTGIAFTRMDVVPGVEHPPVIVYVITCEPAPACKGENSPVVAPTIPVPDHVPPRISAERNAFEVVSQKGPAAFILSLIHI